MATPHQQNPATEKKAAQSTPQTATATLAVAQRDLVEAQTAQACATTAAIAQESGIKVTLPKVCDRYVQQAREQSKPKDKNGAGPHCFEPGGVLVDCKTGK